MSNLPLDRDVIADICRRHHVRRLILFGSPVRGEFDPESSDVDFIVEFDETAPNLFLAYFSLQDELARLLGRPVDLVSRRSMQNPYFAASVEEAYEELYAG